MLEVGEAKQKAMPGSYVVPLFFEESYIIYIYIFSGQLSEKAAFNIWGY